MKLHEFCQAHEIEFEFDWGANGYFFGFKRPYDGFVWPELECVAERIEGGTTWNRGHGKTPNDAMANYCQSIAGRLLAFDNPEGKRRLVRAPVELTI